MGKWFNLTCAYFWDGWGGPPTTVDGSEIWLTTWDVESLVNNGINYLSTGAGFLPSTVVSPPCYLNDMNDKIKKARLKVQRTGKLKWVWGNFHPIMQALNRKISRIKIFYVKSHAFLLNPAIYYIYIYLEFNRKLFRIEIGELYIYIIFISIHIICNLPSWVQVVIRSWNVFSGCKFPVIKNM